MGKWVLFIILNMVLLLPACHSNNEPGTGSEDVTQQALDMMEKGENNQAIQVLEKEMALRPSERTRILLASGYANRGGIRVEKFWGFVIGYQKLVDNAKELDGTADEGTLLEVLSKISPEVRKTIAELNKNLGSLQKISKRLEQIPTITLEQQNDLLIAIAILNESTTPGGRLYRAVLEMIVLKSSTEKGIQFFLSQPSDIQNGCQKNFKFAIDWMKYTYALMQNILSDVVVAFPSQKAEAERIQKQFIDLLGNVANNADNVRAVLCARP